MKVITKNGTVLPVDDSKIDYDKDYISSISTVTLIDDNVYLKPVWIAIVQRDKNEGTCRFGNELEFIDEKVFTHEPIQEELLYFMASCGVGINGYVTVEKAYNMDITYDD